MMDVVLSRTAPSPMTLPSRAVISRATIALTAVPPFDFGRTLSFLRDFAPGEGEQHLSDATLMRALRIAGQTIVCRITSHGTLEAPALSCDLFAAEPIAMDAMAMVRDRIAFWLSLADDVRSLYVVAAADTAFAPVMRAWYGYHQVKFLTPFENACWAVLGQRTPLAVSRVMKDRLIARYGQAVKVDSETYVAFPEPADLAGATVAELAETLGHARKADYIHAVTQAWLGIDEAWLRVAPYDDVEQWFRGIRGIGAWSASFVLVRGLGRMERPVRDDALARSAAAIYGYSFGAAEFATIAARYGTLQGYWGHYLRIAT